METLRREHFNRWYNLIPYYLSIISFEIPFQVSFTFSTKFMIIFYYFIPAIAEFFFNCWKTEFFLIDEKQLHSHYKNRTFFISAGVRLHLRSV